MDGIAGAIAKSVLKSAFVPSARSPSADRSMAGVWTTPLPMVFREVGDDGLRFAAGELEVALQRDRRRRVTLSVAGVSVVGNANFEFTHIHWDNGAVWSKEHFQPAATSRALDSDIGEPSARREQPHLFSDRQADVIIDQINLAVDIPLLGENTERKIFAGLVGQLNPLMKSALSSCMPKELAGAIAVLMDETKPKKDKHEHVRRVLKSMMKEPLVAHLHTKIDTAIPDAFELQVLKKAVGVMIRQMVAQMVVGLEQTGFVSSDE